MNNKELLNKQTEQALYKVTSSLAKQETRPEQLNMAQFLRRFLDYANKPGHAALVEAGTGVGKSFAYLVPVCEYIQASDQKPKFVVATNTINLQEQLLRDIPLIQNHYPKLVFEKAKGRNNYICRRLLSELCEGNLFISNEDIENYKQIEEWIYEQDGTGDKSDLPFEVDSAVWRAIASDSISCHGAGCYFHQKCFYSKAKQKLAKANVIITNHATVLTDLQNQILPDYTHIVIDEAHNFEKNALQSFTTEISMSRFRIITKKLGSNHCQAGLRRGKKLADVQTWIDNTLTMAENFLAGLPEGRVKEDINTDRGFELVNQLKYVLPMLVRSVESAPSPVIKSEFELVLAETKKLIEELLSFLERNLNPFVYWAENNTAKYAPISTNHLKLLWESKVAILTSATISVANSFNPLIWGA